MLLKPKNSTWAIMTFYSAADSVLDNGYAISKVYYVITGDLFDQKYRDDHAAELAERKEKEVAAKK